MPPRAKNIIRLLNLDSVELTVDLITSCWPGGQLEETRGEIVVSLAVS